MFTPTPPFPISQSSPTTSHPLLAALASCYTALVSGGGVDCETSLDALRKLTINAMLANSATEAALKDSSSSGGKSIGLACQPDERLALCKGALDLRHEEDEESCAYGASNDRHVSRQMLSSWYCSKADSQHDNLYPHAVPNAPGPAYLNFSRHHHHHQPHHAPSNSHLHDQFGRRKKTRTVFSRNQVCRLESTFDKKRYLSSSERHDLAKSLSLSETQIKIWFQNRRNKWKRQANSSSELVGDKLDPAIRLGDPDLRLIGSLASASQIDWPFGLTSSHQRLSSTGPQMVAFTVDQSSPR